MRIDDPVPVVPDDDGENGANGAGGEGQPAGTGAQVDEGEEGKVQEPKDEHGWRSRVDKLTKQRTEARTKLSTLETEHAAMKTELETLRGSVGDETVLSAAEAAGVMPQFIDKAGATVLAQAAKLERDLTFFENHIGGEDYTFELGGQTYTGRQAAQYAATIRGQLRTVAGRSEAIKQKATSRLNSLLELGMAAEKSGWKPGAKPATPATPGGKRTPGNPPPLPGEGGGERRAPSREDAVPKIDYSKVQTREELMKAHTEQSRRSRDG
jgi:hypothetical protein